MKTKPQDIKEKRHKHKWINKELLKEDWCFCPNNLIAVKSNSLPSQQIKENEQES